MILFYVGSKDVETQNFASQGQSILCFATGAAITGGVAGLSAFTVCPGYAFPNYTLFLLNSP